MQLAAQKLRWQIEENRLWNAFMEIWVEKWAKKTLENSYIAKDVVKLK